MAIIAARENGVAEWGRGSNEIAPVFFGLEADVRSAFHHLAHEVRRFGIRVVNIEPGVVMTSIFENSTETTRYDNTSPYQPIMRRNGKFYSAGFRDPAQPDQVAEAILAAITTNEYRLRWPVGKDAIGMTKGRPKISDEQWIDMGGDLSDQEYNERFARFFGVQLK